MSNGFIARAHKYIRREVVQSILCCASIDASRLLDIWSCLAQFWHCMPSSDSVLAVAKVLEFRVGSK